MRKWYNRPELYHRRRHHQRRWKQTMSGLIELQTSRFAVHSITINQMQVHCALLGIWPNASGVFNMSTIINIINIIIIRLKHDYYESQNRIWFFFAFWFCTNCNGIVIFLAPVLLQNIQFACKWTERNRAVTRVTSYWRHMSMARAVWGIRGEHEWTNQNTIRM